MDITSAIINENDIQVSLTLTASLEEWKELQKQLCEKYPSWKVSGAITNILWKVRQEQIEKLDEGSN